MVSEVTVTNGESLRSDSGSLGCSDSTNCFRISSILVRRLISSSTAIFSNDLSSEASRLAVTSLPSSTTTVRSCLATSCKYLNFFCSSRCDRGPGGLRAAAVDNCFRGALPPVLFRAVCFVRAIGIACCELSFEFALRLPRAPQHKKIDRNGPSRKLKIVF